METPKPRRRVSRRSVAPSAEARFARKQPYLVGEKPAPTPLATAALKRKARLASRAATPEATSRCLCAEDRIAPYFGLPALLRKSAGSGGVAQRASTYVDDNICRAGGGRLEFDHSPRP